MEAMGKFVQDSMQSGVLVDTGGLKSSAAASRIRIEKGKLTVSDGPFSEAKEVVGGWAIMKGSSKAEVLAVSRRIHGAAPAVLAGLGGNVRAVRDGGEYG